MYDWRSFVKKWPIDVQISVGRPNTRATTHSQFDSCLTANSSWTFVSEICPNSHPESNRDEACTAPSYVIRKMTVCKPKNEVFIITSLYKCTLLFLVSLCNKTNNPRNYFAWTFHDFPILHVGFGTRFQATLCVEMRFGRRSRHLDLSDSEWQSLCRNGRLLHSS